MFGKHDFSKFEIFCYATKPNDGLLADWTYMQNQLEDKQHWRDLSALPDYDAASVIYRFALIMLW